MKRLWKVGELFQPKSIFEQQVLLIHQVSEEYTLHRQTFYLAQDYFDRFMMTQSNIEKGMLQLIGITCLFIASKMEVSGHGHKVTLLSIPS